MAVSKKKSRFGVRKTLIVMIIAAAALAAALSAPLISDMNGISPGDNVTVEIPEGAGSSVAAQILYENGVIRYPSLFRAASKFGGYDGRYQPGSISLHNGMSYSDVLDLLVLSERNAVKTVIPEGYTIKQIAETLENSGICSSSDFYAALDPSLYDYRFLKNLPERSNKLEGYLFPATYEFAPQTSAREVVNTMLKSFDDFFTDEYYKRAEEVNITVDEAVTMASVVERETNSDGERAKVAGVFYNRLNSDMNLESCATVQYALGTNKPVLSVADTQTDSPYNTYIHSGLPIGPICSPGAECIKAALYPKKTDALYFLLGTDGRHIFSKTYEEHKKAMEENGL